MCGFVSIHGMVASGIRKVLFLRFFRKGCFVVVLMVLFGVPSLGTLKPTRKASTLRPCTRKASSVCRPEWGGMGSVT